MLELYIVLLNLIKKWFKSIVVIKAAFRFTNLIWVKTLLDSQKSLFLPFPCFSTLVFSLQDLELFFIFLLSDLARNKLFF